MTEKQRKEFRQDLIEALIFEGKAGANDLREITGYGFDDIRAELVAMRGEGLIAPSPFESYHDADSLFQFSGGPISSAFAGVYA